MSLNITLVATDGRCETLPLPSTTTVQELLDWSKALFGFPDNAVVTLRKEGTPMTATATLEQAGVQDGDMLAAEALVPRPAAAARPPPPPAAGGGLDFSSLLATAPAAAASSQPPAPVYYEGMSLDDAMHYNPHPHTFISLLKSKEHLFRELNYHNPLLVKKLEGQSIEASVTIWRDELVKGGIKAAFRASTAFHHEQDMQKRLESNPEDADAKTFYKERKSKAIVQEQYQQMMQEYPESFGNVLMLYIQAKINGHSIQAFCDSGAQMTIMSKRVALECGLEEYIDTRFAGMAVGVGTGKILGKIHMVQLQIGDLYYPCSVSVMDDAASGKEMPFLLGLDMMKRHLCQIDLENHVLKFRLAPGKYMETPFLHEHDLSQSQGGTKGFDAEAENQKLLEEASKRADKGDDENMEEGE
jgi:DNA damage-inducible protein 1